MKSWTTNNNIKIIQLIRGRSNAFLISGHGKNILVDTGTSNNYKTLCKRIDLLIPSTEKLDYLILTHCHFDHCQNAAEIKNRLGCSIVMSGREAKYSDKGETPLPALRWPKLPLARLFEIAGPNRFRFKVFHPDILFTDNSPFPILSNHVQLINTPGHSAGSISVIVDEHIAIVGDTLFGVLPNSVYPPFRDCHEELVKSWGKLLETGCALFLPGHGRPIIRKLLEKKYREISTWSSATMEL